MLLNKWTLPSHYMGESWYEYYVGISRNRDSDAMARSNFEVFLRSLGGESDTVIVVRENHFLCGWVEWVAIHESDTDAIRKAEAMLQRLDDYPILDEEHCGEVELNEANETWQNCYDWRERIEYIRDHDSQFEFHDFAEMMAVVRGEYFIGYASELLH